MTSNDYILAVDVESAGKGIRANFLIQVGLALVDRSSKTILASFSSYVRKPIGCDWEKRCVDEFWSKHPELWEQAKIECETAPPLDIVAGMVKDFIRKHVEDPEHTTLVYDTAGYDAAWFHYLLGDDDDHYILGKYRDSIDVSSFYLGIARSTDSQGSSKAAVQVALGFKFPEWPVQHTHRAEEDAAVIALNYAAVIDQLEKLG
jgi:inhibitor of KinA sporulation pathway (predicted exonuclease)